MQIQNAAVTGSFTYNGVDISSITGSTSNITSLNAITASILSTTASLNVASGSAITRLSALEVTSGSNITRLSALESASGSAITRLSSIESTTGSLNTASGSAITRLNALEVTSGSNITRIAALEVTSGSNITRISSLEVTSGSNISRLSSLEARTGSYATTGSNTFVGSQTITGSILGSGSLSINGCIVSTGAIVAQTINVQQVTSSIVYSCGSNIFGSAIGNTQVFTGSMFITGSNIFANVGNTCFAGTVCAAGNILVGGTGTCNYLPKFTGTSTIGNSLVFDNGTNVGIGTTDPNGKLTIKSSSENNLRLENGSELAIIRVLNGGALDIWSHGDDANEIYFRQGTGSGLVKMTLNASGNLGLGVTPSAWNSNSKALQLPSFVSLSQQNSGALNLMSYAYESSANTFTYGATGVYATRLSMNPNDGVIAFYNSTTGTIGCTVSFTQAMTLDASGRLALGRTSADHRLDVQGNILVRNTLANASFYLAQEGDNSSTLYQYNNGTLKNVIATNGVSYFTGGLVGMGITSPSEKLHLRDTSTGYVGLRLEGSCGYAGSDWTIYASSTSPSSADDFLGFYNNSTADGATAEYKFRLFKTGAATFSSTIGATGANISTSTICTSASTTLGSSRGIVIDANTTTNNAFVPIGFSWASSISTYDPNWGMALKTVSYNAGTADLVFYTGGSVRMTINNGGGTSFTGGVTATQLTANADNSGVIADVAGRHGLMKYFNYGTGLVGRNTETDGSISTWLGRFSGSITSPTTVFQDLVITNGGRVGIGTLSPSQNLGVVGAIKSSVSTTEGAAIAVAYGRTLYKVFVSSNYDGGNAVRAGEWNVLTNNEGTGITNTTQIYNYNGQSASFSVSGGNLIISGLSAGNNQAAVFTN